MDMTLADYINRTMKRLEQETNSQENLQNNQYLVYPEKRSEDSDEKINPFSQV